MGRVASPLAWIRLHIQVRRNSSNVIERAQNEHQHAPRAPRRKHAPRSGVGPQGNTKDVRAPAAAATGNQR